MDAIEDDLFQMESFDNSDNFKDYSPQKVQESFRKLTLGQPSYFWQQFLYELHKQ